MRTIKILSILFLLLGFSQCGGSTLVKKSTLKVEKAFYNKWFGGQPGVRGTKVEIHLKDASEVIFVALYFQGKRTKVEVSQMEKFTRVIAHFSTLKRKNRNLILDADITKELENTLPSLEEFPFQLKENEAILSYKKEGKTLYFKIENIKKLQSISFPSMNKK
ncbi:MAG: hypothetical protein QMB86_04980 [Polaribacter sp.]